MHKFLKLHLILRIISPLLISGSLFAVSDEDLLALVQNALRANTTTAQTKLEIKASSGVINLSGNVTTKLEADEAIKIASSFPGVKDVNITALTVDNSSLSTDEYMIAKIKGAFIREKLFGHESANINMIEIAARNGIVSLSGVADSQDEINKAVEIAKQVVGVTEVQAQIILK